MNVRNGLAKIDVIVAVACLVFLLVNIPVILAGGREKAKQEVCMANLCALTDAWQMFANDNEGEIPAGDVWYSWTFPASIGGPQLAWHEWPHQFPHSLPPTAATNYSAVMPGNCVATGTCTEKYWQHAIAEGLLWKYTRDYNIYRCPVGNKGEYVTYAMSHSMNTWRNPPQNQGSAGPGSVSRTISLISQILRPDERFVFLDVGVAKRGAFFLNYDGSGSAPPGTFGDHAPCRHGHGTTFSFADGHTEYREWKDGPPGYDDPNTWGGSLGATPYCYCDWRWFCKVTWGDIPSKYSCATPGKQCEN